MLPGNCVSGAAVVGVVGRVSAKAILFFAKKPVPKALAWIVHGAWLCNLEMPYIQSVTAMSSPE